MRDELDYNMLKRKRVVSGPDYRDLGAILLFIFLLPYVVSFFFGNIGMEKGENVEETENEYIVCNATAAGTEKIPLERYLINRLPATIDMEYDEEVLKAQAVVLRTELIRNYYESMKEENLTEDKSRKLSEDGKKYIYVESNLPAMSEKIYEKSCRAVEDTRGMYMVYEKVPVIAPYFAVSAGKTRNGNEVFAKQDYPYLQSVVCERDFTADQYVQTVKVSKHAFYERLGKLAGLEEVSAGWLFEKMEKGLEDNLQIRRDEANYVTEVLFEDAHISGEKIRTAFLLNSACMEWEETDNTVILKVKGVGHGLGLCQYGANELAGRGSDYIDILKYFYTDIVLEKYE